MVSSTKGKLHSVHRLHFSVQESSQIYGQPWVKYDGSWTELPEYPWQQVWSTVQVHPPVAASSRNAKPPPSVASMDTVLEASFQTATTCPPAAATDVKIASNGSNSVHMILERPNHFEEVIYLPLENGILWALSKVYSVGSSHICRRLSFSNWGVYALDFQHPVFSRWSALKVLMG